MKRFNSVLLVLIMVFSVVSMSLLTASAYTVPSNMQWWADSRLGMFIHFGSYSYYGQGEWAMSQKSMSKQTYQTTVSANFNPMNFNATTIANYAKNAGMKYLVITAKHHEGFSMWDTAVASFKDYTGTKMYSLQKYTPFGSTGRDVLMELKNACDAAGIKFCLYYSILDWNHSSQTGYNFTQMTSMTARTSYIADMKAQLRELVTKYNPAVLWFDGDWLEYDGTPTVDKWWTKADGQDLYSYVKGLNPNIIINERVARGFDLGDFACPEATVPAAPLSRSWETCQTMNGAWGYTSSKESSYRSVQSIIQEMVTVVSREGNYLLNIGPKGDGSMTGGSQTILNGVGSWMAIYNDSIYGTTRNPFGSDPSWGRYTQKGNKVYAHVFTWPANGTLTASVLPGTISKVYLLNNTGTSLSYSVSGSNINISIPTAAPNANDSVVVIEYSSISNAFPAAGVSYKIVNRNSGKALDVSGGSIADGANIIQYTYGGANNQKWQFVDAGGGYYKIKSVKSGKVMDISGGSTADGAKDIQWTDTGATNQQWQIIESDGGYYKIKNRKSGKVLDITGSSTADRAQCIQWTDTGSNNQQWQITP